MKEFENYLIIIHIKFSVSVHAQIPIKVDTLFRKIHMSNRFQNLSWIDEKFNLLTHCGLVMACNIIYLIIIGSGNGFLFISQQAITWTNVHCQMD